MKKYFVYFWEKSAPQKAAYIALTYLIFGLIWILISDKLILYVPPRYTNRWLIHTFMDCAFILTSYTFLYIIIKRGFESINKERKKSKFHEKLYQLIADNTGDVVWEFDLIKNKFSFASPSVEKLLGYTQQEVLQISLLDIMDKKHHYLFNELLPVRIQESELGDETKKVNSYDIDAVRKDGKIIYTEVEAYLNKDKNGKVISLIGVTRDITERRNADLALKESESKYRELFENNLAGVFRTSITGEVLECNTAFAQLFGYEKKEMVLHEMAQDYYLKPEDRKKYVELLKANGQLKNFEYRRKRADGTPIWTLENVSIIKNSEGLPTFLEGTIFDITAHKEAEAQLIKERNQAQLYFEVAGVMFAHLDIKGNITLMNKKGQEILEYDLDEILGRNWFETMLPEEIKNEIHENFNKIINDKKEISEYFENEVICKSGKKKLIAFHNTVIRNESGEVAGVLFSGEDITERKKAQEALHESRERLLKAQQVAHMGFLNWNLITNEIYWSDEVCKMYGKKPGDNYQTLETTLKLTHPEDFSLVREKIEETIKDEQKYNLDYRLLKPDGKILWVHAQGELLKDNSGKPVTLLGTVVDITERKNAESALKESEERYRRLVEISPDGILLHQDEIIVFANKAALKILNANSHMDLLGKHTMEFIHPEYRDRLIERIERTSRNEQEFSLSEKKLVRLDGSNFDAEVSIISTEYKGKKAIQFIIRDITERKLAEKELNEYREGLEILVKLRTGELDKANMKLKEDIRRQKEFEMMLQNSLEKEKELNELKSSFISTTSHEFRTPLTSVLSSIELIQMFGKKWSEEKLNEHFERIKHSIEYLTKLLNDVLTISRSENGKIEFDPQTFDLYDFCTELLEESGLKISKKHNVKFEYLLKNKKIYADQGLLRFILTNLLSNAFKYSPDGGNVEFIISFSGNNIKFKISDDGIGIMKEDQKFLFEPFYRGKNSLKIQGTGLGLSIVKRAIELHAGEINFSSNPGEGTTFYVKIPVRK